MEVASRGTWGQRGAQKELMPKGGRGRAEVARQWVGSLGVSGGG